MNIPTVPLFLSIHFLDKLTEDFEDHVNILFRKVTLCGYSKPIIIFITPLSKNITFIHRLAATLFDIFWLEQISSSTEFQQSSVSMG